MEICRSEDTHSASGVALLEDNTACVWAGDVPPYYPCSRELSAHTLDNIADDLWRIIARHRDISTRLNHESICKNSWKCRNRKYDDRTLPSATNRLLPPLRVHRHPHCCTLGRKQTVRRQEPWMPNSIEKIRHAPRLARPAAVQTLPHDE